MVKQNKSLAWLSRTPFQHSVVNVNFFLLVMVNALRIVLFVQILVNQG